jgi:hypothetical protein
LDVERRRGVRGSDFDPLTHQFTGEFATEANKLCEEEYAAGFELPEIA